MTVQLKYLNVLVYEPDKDLARMISYYLLMHGYAPRLAEDMSEIPELLTTQIYPIFICDLNLSDPASESVINVLKKFRQISRVLTILHLRNAAEDSLLRLIKDGFSQIISKPFDGPGFITKLNQSITGAAPGYIEKRKHVRVSIPTTISGKIMLTNLHKRKLTANIQEISAGGLSVNFYEERSYGSFSSGDILRNCMLLVKNLDMFLNLKVVSSTKETTRLQFLGLEEDKHLEVCQFIYDQLKDRELYRETEAY